MNSQFKPPGTAKPIGIAYSQRGSAPDVFNYSFVMNPKQRSQIKVRLGQYCFAYSALERGLIVGVIEQIEVVNEYFANSQTVKDFQNQNLHLGEYFPSEDWEREVAKVKVLGIIRLDAENNDIVAEARFNNKIPLHRIPSEQFKHIDKISIPVKPGENVFPLRGKPLRHFLGLDTFGLNIGKLKHSDLEVSLDVDRLFRKHLAILAQSGAGKSYLLSVLIEELLTRSTYDGTPAAILIDVHGEYRYLAEKPDVKANIIDGDDDCMSFMDLHKKINYYHGSFLQIRTSNLHEYDFMKYQPGISRVQLRELRKAIKNCKETNNRYRKKETKSQENRNRGENDENKVKNKKENVELCSKKKKNTKESILKEIENSLNDHYTIKDIISELEMDPDINVNTKKALTGWLRELDNLHIFGKVSSPPAKELAKVGELTIIDLSSIISMRKKQILLHYFTKKLFYLRRMDQIPPYILFLEEAHNFLPENGGKSAIAKSILEKMAREGRKFFAQLVLVSQRPVHLSTTALSQCNSQIIMRITNPYDLDHIKSTSEALTRNSMKIINTLPTGNALVMGAALNYPVFVDVRTRGIKDKLSGKSISDVCKQYIIKEEKKRLRAATLIQNSADGTDLNPLEEKKNQTLVESENSSSSLDKPNYLEEGENEWNSNQSTKESAKSRKAVGFLDFF